MIAAIGYSILAIAFFLFFISKYLKIKPLQSGTNAWNYLESNFEFCKTWKFKSIIVFICLAFLVQCSNELDANKYGIDASKVMDYKNEAKKYNLSIEEYKVELDKSKSLKFEKFSEYFKAKEAGFNDSQTWEDAKRLGANTFANYQSEIEKMKARGISNVNEYIALLNKEAEAAKAKEVAKQEAKEKSSENKTEAGDAKVPVLERYSYRKTGRTDSNNVTPDQFKRICSKTAPYIDDLNMQSTFGYSTDDKVVKLWENMKSAAFTVSNVRWSDSFETCLVNVTAAGTVNGDAINKKFICVIESMKPADKGAYYVSGLQYCN